MPGLYNALFAAEEVSVLFSEPKIPQSTRSANCRVRPLCFSALQRAENSSIPGYARSGVMTQMFQCSSASRKFLNDDVL